MIKREDIRIRDPFVLVDECQKKYYMYGTSAVAGARTFSVYVSEDLNEFEGPYTVFDGVETSFWGTEDFWAPEVHVYIEILSYTYPIYTTTGPYGGIYIEDTFRLGMKYLTENQCERLKCLFQTKDKRM